MAHRALSATLLLLLAGNCLLASPARNNDDSCDIALLPAATLLLPYFEVSANGQQGTLRTITNVSPQEQIAHVTLWTDYSYPVIDFNVYLTGYDVQSISLYDVIWRGVIASDRGTGNEVTVPGAFSQTNAELDLSDCARLPGTIPAVYVTRMQSAFTTGRVAALANDPACNQVGSSHTAAVGYATIDVVRRCTTATPGSPGYLSDDILWANVLIGDYQHLDATRHRTGGDPMVHIRAVPEGGTAIERRVLASQYPVPFRRTFYSRYQPLPGGRFATFDARQPLPSVFAAHWISGGSSGYQTHFKVWRESVPQHEIVPCSILPQDVTAIVENVIFDEDENPKAIPPPDVATPILPVYRLPATSFTSVYDHEVFPVSTAGAVGGWVYLNLDNNEYDAIASQNWLVTTLTGSGLYSVDETGFALGNGCSPAPGPSEISADSEQTIGPAANINPEFE